MNPPSLPGQRGANAWLRKLMDCPSVAVIAANGPTAQIEVGGVSARAWWLEAGLCVGLRIELGSDPPEGWLDDATLSLAATPAATDDALAIDGEAWLLWHRYDHDIEASQLEERLALQLALARRLAESAQTAASGPGSDIGRLI
ncbi:hypothetical protein [Cupriavidus sp. UGS-1]|uniref:hypothetical protein n=1 Tax=Cupriavidus sp. UGS-1 TaxID=2899826 RepID=UPI001E477A41|nr:hypothetical protein [Cupriavidus sp. UGS-1]MCD9119850.1 hypothetical protein [Cupriavidus sp. UGS-1]